MQIKLVVVVVVVVIEEVFDFSSFQADN